MIEWLTTYLLHSTVVLCSVLLLLHYTPFRTPAVRDVLLRTALLVPLLTAAMTTLPQAADPSAEQIGPASLPTSSLQDVPAPLSTDALVSSASRRPALYLILPDQASDGVTLLMVGSLAFAGLRFSTAWWFLRSRLTGRIEPDHLGPRLQDMVGSPLRVQLFWADVDVPCALGRRRILLPPHVQQTLTPDELRAVLAHEYAHLLRRDPLWNIGLAFVTQLLWFQPLNWLALSAWRRASEEQCDAWAGGRTSPLTLAQALLKLAGVRGHETPFMGPMTMSAARTTHLTDRINALIHFKETHMERSHLVLLATSPLLLAALIPPLALATSPTHQRQVVVLDAAHGGSDPGAVGFAVEKEVTLQLARQIQQQLVNAGVQVIMAREDDKGSSLADRIKLAASPATMYVSLHTNASPDPQQQGVVAYVASPGQDKLGSQPSGILARRLVDAVSTTTGTRNLGVHPIDSAALRKATVPAVLLEVGFVTNRAEGLALTTMSYQQQISSAVARVLQTSLH